MSLSFAYGDGTEILTSGQLIDVPPGSALETAVGAGNLIVPTGQQLAVNANDCGRWVSN